MDIDKASDNLHVYMSSYDIYLKHDLNESDTRSKIIDKLLTDVLNWSEYDINREGRVVDGYYDYEVATANYRFIVEAKRLYSDLSIPNTGRRCKIRTIYKGNEEVIDQIRRYLIQKNLSYGIITNGRQFIVAKYVNTDGRDWKDNACVYFRSLNDVSNNFVEFHNMLSKDSVIANGDIFLGEEMPFVGVLIEGVVGPDDELVRNEFSNEIMPLIRSVLTELRTDDEYSREVMTECYVMTDDIRKYDSEINVLFTDAPPRYDSRIVPVRNTDNIIDQIGESLEGSRVALPDPIVLIGGKGAGKTTFIRYFLDVSLDSNVKRNRPVVYIDFKDYTPAQIENTTLIYRDILRKLYDEYPQLNLEKMNVLRKIYARDLRSRRDGVWSVCESESELLKREAEYLESQLLDPETHLEYVSKYLSGTCRKRLCIVYDNADQHSVMVQKNVFMLAHSIYSRCQAMAIISLREGYYYQWRNSPPFDAYRSNVYHITAPPYRTVLNRRIQYALRNMSAKEIVASESGKTWKVQKDTVVKWITTYYNTLFSESYPEVMEYLEATCYPNIRAGLERCSEFLLSGHTKTGTYLVATQDRIPIWEFVKSIALGSRMYYRSSVSSLRNIYHPYKHGKSIMIKLYILDDLMRQAVPQGDEASYVNYGEIARRAYCNGFSEEDVRSSIGEMIQWGMVDTASLATDVAAPLVVTDSDSVRITNSGEYHLKKLCGRFHYIDMVLQDTPISNQAVYEELKAVFPHSNREGKRDLRRRIETADIFIKHLTNCAMSVTRGEAVDREEVYRDVVSRYVMPLYRSDRQRLERTLPYYA